MKISIITICLNSERYISQTIESVLRQSHEDLEYIIVDGGSTDGTIDIIRNHAEQDNRISWVSEPDKGISDAMNKGVKMASGEIIAHLHSDEYYLDSTVVADVVAAFTRAPRTVWLTAGFNFVDANDNFIKEIKVRAYSYTRLIHSNIILHPATFIMRDTFNAVGGFDPSLRYCMDYHLWLRLGAIDDPTIINRALAAFRIHPGSRSITDADFAYAEEFDVRMEYLRQRGIWDMPYRLEYAVKKRLNKVFTKRLISVANMA